MLLLLFNLNVGVNWSASDPSLATWTGQNVAYAFQYDAFQNDAFAVMNEWTGASVGAGAWSGQSPADGQWTPATLAPPLWH